MQAPLLAVQMGTCTDFVMFLLLLGQHGWSARPPNITCGNETGLFCSKNSNKIPPPELKSKKFDSSILLVRLIWLVYCGRSVSGMFRLQFFVCWLFFRVVLFFFCCLKTKYYFCTAFERYGNGALVQLVRIHACHAWGHGFESRTHRKSLPKIIWEALFLVCSAWAL